jgi:hypothetical protein
MEGLNKYLGTNVLITRETKEGNGDRFVTRAVGYFRLKGFERVVEVHELLDEAAQMEATRLARGFRGGVADFQRSGLRPPRLVFGGQSFIRAMDRGFLPLRGLPNSIIRRVTTGRERLT